MTFLVIGQLSISMHADPTWLPGSMVEQPVACADHLEDAVRRRRLLMMAGFTAVYLLMRSFSAPDANLAVHAMQPTPMHAAQTDREIS